MERKKRSKGRGWESCYVKKIYGMFGVEMRASGQKIGQILHTHTHTHSLTHTHTPHIHTLRGPTNSLIYSLNTHSVIQSLTPCRPTIHAISRPLTRGREST